MTSIQTQIFPPPSDSLAVDEKRRLAPPLRQWLFTLQNLLPLIVVDTSAGNEAFTLPPAGLAASTGQSNQNMEITYLKSTADANTVAITGAVSGVETIVAQYEFRRFKSDGTNWWLIS